MRILVSRHLENFLAIFEARNLHGAAALKGITQPALSKSLKLLEEEIGTPLFGRTNRGLTPTPAGETLHRYARRLDQEARLASIELHEAADHLYGRLRIGVGPALAATIFPQVVSAYHSRFPHVAVTVETGVSSALIAALDQDRLDVAVSALPKAPLPDGMIAMPLTEHRLVVIARSGHPLAGRTSSLKDLYRFRRVGFVEDREFEERAIRLFGGKMQETAPVIQASSLSIIFGLLRDNDYYAIVSELVLPRAAMEGLCELAFATPFWTLTAGLICRESVSLSRAVAALRDELERVTCGGPATPAAGRALRRRGNLPPLSTSFCRTPGKP